MEDAFITVIEAARTKDAAGAGGMIDQPSSRLAAKARRVAALIRKELRQVVRDPSSIAIGVVLPLMLILLFGYALSLDVKNVPIAVALEDPSSPRPARSPPASGSRLILRPA